MRKMSDTIARLAALRAHQHLPANDTLVDRLLDLPEFGSNPGALLARYHLPESLPEGAPLVVVLHGCTQNAAGYDHGSGWSRLADEAGFALLFPEQQRRNNLNLCFNWFASTDTTRDSGEVLSIRQMIEMMVVAHGLDRRRIFITGLSAGGAMASAMLADYPDVFAGGAIIAGLAYGSANTISEAFDRMRGHGGPTGKDLQRLLRGASRHQGAWPRISIWQGSADHTVAASNADAIAAQWRGVHGLAVASSSSEVAGGRAKRVWCGATGQVLIEINVIAGMGHGTPLDGDLGVPGPFMLDVGISSTREIARFWDIDKPSEPLSQKSSHGQRPSAPAAKTSLIVQRRIAANRPSHAPASDQHGVGKVIEDALRAAGLMR